MNMVAPALLQSRMPLGCFICVAWSLMQIGLQVEMGVDWYHVVTFGLLCTLYIVSFSVPCLAALEFCRRAVFVQEVLPYCCYLQERLRQDSTRSIVDK
ncbi:MAG: hypothetical protein KVP17_003213 [Porospora cf. gigantea B]|nr:MAG: hypothetical protein KVP17_003213 [Porospora cf. gigantea B]